MKLDRITRRGLFAAVLTCLLASSLWAQSRTSSSDPVYPNFPMSLEYTIVPPGVLNGNFDATIIVSVMDVPPAFVNDPKYPDFAKDDAAISAWLADVQKKYGHTELDSISTVFNDKLWQWGGTGGWGAIVGYDSNGLPNRDSKGYADDSQVKSLFISTAFSNSAQVTPRLFYKTPKTNGNVTYRLYRKQGLKLFDSAATNGQAYHWQESVTSGMSTTEINSFAGGFSIKISGEYSVSAGITAMKAGVELGASFVWTSTDELTYSNARTHTETFDFPAATGTNQIWQGVETLELWRLINGQKDEKIVNVSFDGYLASIQYVSAPTSTASSASTGSRAAVQPQSGSRAAVQPAIAKIQIPCPTSPCPWT